MSCCLTKRMMEMDGDGVKHQDDEGKMMGAR
jgi:hypothetical protein